MYLPQSAGRSEAEQRLECPKPSVVSGLRDQPVHLWKKPLGVQANVSFEWGTNLIGRWLEAFGF